VEYIQTVLPEDERGDLQNGRVADSCSLRSKAPRIIFHQPETSPRSLQLEQNLPNPFNNETAISFSLTELAVISLKVVDLLGHEIANLAEGRFAAGTHHRKWNATALASGVYWYVLRREGMVERRKMELLR